MSSRNFTFFQFLSAVPRQNLQCTFYALATVQRAIIRALGTEVLFGPISHGYSGEGRSISIEAIGRYNPEALVVESIADDVVWPPVDVVNVSLPYLHRLPTNVALPRLPCHGPKHGFEDWELYHAIISHWLRDLRRERPQAY